MDWLQGLRRWIGFGEGRATIEDVRRVLGELPVADADRRREILRMLESWGRTSLPAGAARLVLDDAARHYPPLESYPPTPNEGLVRLLW